MSRAMFGWRKARVGQRRTPVVRICVFVAFWTLTAFSSIAQLNKGMAEESLGFKSSILKDTVKYSILFPPGYTRSEQTYPVVYLLHGYTNDETTWLRTGRLQEIMIRGLEKSEIADLIVVMPYGSNTRYCNDYRHQRRWRDMFIEEFIPFIEQKYPVKSGREFRAIAGQSMGGYGALMLAMNHPDAFAYCVALGAALYTDEDVISRPKEKYDRYWSAIYGENLEGKARITDTWKSHNPLDLVGSVPQDELKTIRFYMDCGDDDPRTKGNSILHLRMLEAGIPHEYRVRQGGHDWRYWRAGIYEGLRFITNNL